MNPIPRNSHEVSQLPELSEFQAKLLEIVLSNPDEHMLLTDVASVSGRLPNNIGNAAGFLARKGFIQRNYGDKVVRKLWLSEQAKKEIQGG